MLFVEKTNHLYKKEGSSSSSSVLDYSGLFSFQISFVAGTSGFLDFQPHNYFVVREKYSPEDSLAEMLIALISHLI